MTELGERTELMRRLFMAGGLLAVVVLVGATGYHSLGEGRWGWVDCLYMTIITLSTVGFSETLPGMSEVEAARIWTLALIVLGSGILLFFASTLTAWLVEGDIQGAIRRRRMQKEIDALRDHLIVVGVGATGEYVVEELLASGAPFVAIDTDIERLRRVAEEASGRLLWLHGDATDDHILERAGINRARGIATTLREDKDNLFVSITARALNPDVRIVAKMVETSTGIKLKRAGADATVSPNRIGGLRMASELVRPNVVQFLDRMREDDLHVEEVHVGQGSRLQGVKLRDARIRDHGNVLVLAVRGADGRYSYNPGPDHVIGAESTLVVLALSGALTKLRSYAARAASLLP